MHNLYIYIWIFICIDININIYIYIHQSTYIFFHMFNWVTFWHITPALTTNKLFQASFSRHFPGILGFYPCIPPPFSSHVTIFTHPLFNKFRCAKLMDKSLWEKMMVEQPPYIRYWYIKKNHVLCVFNYIYILYHQNRPRQPKGTVKSLRPTLAKQQDQKNRTKKTNIQNTWEGRNESQGSEEEARKTFPAICSPLPSLAFRLTSLPLPPVLAFLPPSPFLFPNASMFGKPINPLPPHRLRKPNSLQKTRQKEIKLINPLPTHPLTHPHAILAPIMAPHRRHNTDLWFKPITAFWSHFFVSLLTLASHSISQKMYFQGRTRGESIPHRDTIPTGYIPSKMVRNAGLHCT